MSGLRSLGERCTVRPWRDSGSDVAFVYDTWLNSWRNSRFAGVIRNCDYYDTTRSVIEDLVSRGATILVAELGGELLGFVCAESKDGKVVHHYTYVKDPFLRKGVEERLLRELGGEAGWFTFAQERFLKDRQWKHAPEMARRLKL